MSSVRAVGSLQGENEIDTRLLLEMYEEAERFLKSFSWCEEILQAFVGEIAIGGVVAAFCFQIRPAFEGIDEWLWVLTGDIPPAYLVTDRAPNAREALAVYIDEMKKWVEAAKDGAELDELIPVNVQPSLEHAEMLEKRLNYLEREVLHGPKAPWRSDAIHDV